MNETDGCIATEMVGRVVDNRREEPEIGDEELYEFLREHFLTPEEQESGIASASCCCLPRLVLAAAANTREGESSAEYRPRYNRKYYMQRMQRIRENSELYAAYLERERKRKKVQNAQKRREKQLLQGCGLAQEMSPAPALAQRRSSPVRAKSESEWRKQKRLTEKKCYLQRKENPEKYQEYLSRRRARSRIWREKQLKKKKEEPRCESVSV